MQWVHDACMIFIMMLMMLMVSDLIIKKYFQVKGIGLRGTGRETETDVHLVEGDHYPHNHHHDHHNDHYHHHLHLHHHYLHRAE